MRTILFLASSPNGLPDLKLSNEQNSLEDILRQSIKRDEFNIVSRHAASENELYKSLIEHKPCILHIAGHGEYNTLCLEDKDGYRDDISIEGLIRFLQESVPSLKCLIMNACYSLENYNQLKGVSSSKFHIIGMNQKITNNTALLFSQRFYHKLFNDGVIKTAFLVAKSSLNIKNNPEIDIPVFAEGNFNEHDESMHYLHQFPRSPMVEAQDIKPELIESYANLISNGNEHLYISKANNLRLEADNDNKVTIIKIINLPPVNHANPLNFWYQVFKEAGLHGPRMLAALIYALPEEQLSISAKKIRNDLLMKLKTHT